MSSEADIEVAIQVEHLSKCYHIYEKPRDRLKQMIYPRLQRTLGRLVGQYYREFWALRDVSFNVKKGEIVGVMGRNGSGKSTLLQMICNTLNPTDGQIRTEGRVAALLELGSGFNPEFTGLENVYMNSQILGLSRQEIEDKLPAIEKFAGIGEFIHQPVKTYSSGMFARLAFSVAAHVDPDILIVDEALSVGDSWFQHKSMARMRQLMSKGCTVLFVSHSIDAVRALCSHAIWLDSGSIKMQGDVTTVTNAYMNDVFVEHNRITLEAQGISSEPTIPTRNSSTPADSEKPEQPATSNSDNEVLEAALTADGGSVLKVTAVQIINSKGAVAEHLTQGEDFRLDISLEFLKSARNISVGFVIKDQFGQELTGESIFNTYRQSLDFAAGQKVRITFGSNMMFRGGESYSVALRINQVSRWDRTDNVVLYSDDVAAVVDVLADTDEPMWFKFRQPFKVSIEK